MNLKIQHYIDLITVLTQKEIKVRYKNSFLGYLWSIGHPLAFAMVFFIAFKVVMRIQIEDYALFLIAGLFPWQWFSNSVNAASMVFLGNASIIKKVNFPRNLIPFTQVLQDMIHFILAIPVIVLFLFIYHKSPSLSWVYGIPALLAIQFLMTYGFCLTVSSTNLFFRDLERLAVIFTTLMFYFTPIIYPESMIPERYKYLVNINPLTPLMVSWRNLFLNGILDPLSLIISLTYSIFAFMIGYLIYRRLSWKFAEVL
ncbi:MAG: ABC transporter permease [Thermodesulfovibrionales bacterium]|nr:ABC transporter permease [Thermodesulfovibrionales bacterium]